MYHELRVLTKSKQSIMHYYKSSLPDDYLSKTILPVESVPVGVPEVSAVASRKLALNDTRAISLLRLLLINIGESMSPSAAN